MRRTLRAASLLASLVLATCVRSQGWAWQGGEAGADRAHAVTVLPSGGFVVTGTSEALDGAWMTRFHVTGDVAWQRSIAPVATTSPVLAVAMPDGSTMVAGTVDRSGIGTPWLACVSSAGFILWQRAYDLGRTSVTSALAPTADGFALAGHDFMDFEWILRVDASGDVIRFDDMHVPGSNASFRPDALVATPDGGLIVTGTRFASGILVRLAADGSVVMGEALDFSCARVQGMSIAAMRDGSWVVSGTQTCSGDSLFVARLDASLAPTIAASVHAPPSFLEGPILHSLAPTPDGFVGVGTTGAGGSALVLKLDAALGLQWQRTYSGGGASLRSVVGLPGGDVVAAGERLDELLAMRTDPTGRLATTCGTVSDAEYEVTRTAVSVVAFEVSTSSGAATALPWGAVVTTVSLPLSALGDRHEPDSCDAPAHLDVGATLALDFCSDPTDWIEFVACAGSSYTITTSGLGPVADTVVDLLSWDCSSVLATDDDSGGGLASRLDWTCPIDGRYRVRVRQKDGTAGPDRGYVAGIATGGAACATWLRTFQAGTQLRPQAVAELADGTIVAAGHHRDGRAAPTQDDPLVLHVAAEGDLLGAESLVEPGNDVVTDVAARSAGGFVLTGLHAPPATGPTVAFLRAADASGGVLWVRAYERPDEAGFYDVVALRDGGALGVGFNFGDDGHMHPWIMKVDGAGDVDWNVELSVASTSASASAALEDADGSLVVVSHVSNLPVTLVTVLEPTGAVRSHRIYEAYAGVAVALAPGGGLLVGGAGTLMSLAPDGSVRWCNVYGSPSRALAGLNDVQATSNGGCLLAGTMREGVSGPDRPLLLEVDALGDVESSRWLDFTGALWALVSTRDGGFVACGHGDISGPVSTGLLLRLDSSGRLAGTCLPTCDLIGVTPVAVTVTDVVPTLETVNVTVVPLGSEQVARPVAVDTLCAGSGSGSGYLPPDEVSRPGSPEPLVFDGHDTLRWETGWPSRSTSFNLYRGDLRDLRRREHGACFVTRLARNSAVDGERPALGACFTYLVTGVNGAGEGTLGFASDGVERLDATPCP